MRIAIHRGAARVRLGVAQRPRRAIMTSDPMHHASAREGRHVYRCSQGCWKAQVMSDLAHGGLHVADDLGGVGLDDVPLLAGDRVRREERRDEPDR